MDLDQTAICSKHRQLTLPDGSLDLAHWRENCTPDKIMQDSLLPVAGLWRVLYGRPSIILAVCTARVVSQADFDFLALHGLHYNHFLCRDGDSDTRRDADLKRDKLTPLIATIQPHRIVLFDDSASVRAMGESMGFDLIVDSVEWNRVQQAKKVMAI